MSPLLVGWLVVVRQACHNMAHGRGGGREAGGGAAKWKVAPAQNTMGKRHARWRASLGRLGAGCSGLAGLVRLGAKLPSRQAAEPPSRQADSLVRVGAVSPARGLDWPEPEVINCHQVLGFSKSPTRRGGSLFVVVPFWRTPCPQIHLVGRRRRRLPSSSL